MSYTPAWSNADPQGDVSAEHWARRIDVQELLAAVNRRRRLVFLHEQTLAPGEMLSTPPLLSCRQEIVDTILTPSPGGQGGTPPTPEAMAWLWPVADANENGTLAADGSADVSLFEQLNGTAGWTDPDLSPGELLRAVHVNELRRAIEWTSRGRWTLPIHFTAGILSLLPDTPWMGQAIANNGSDELRSVGYAVVRASDNPPVGLSGASARASSKIEITADVNCTVEVYRVGRTMDFASDPPTWNQYDPSASADWDAPGGTGPADAQYIGTLALQADTPGTLTGPAVQAAMQILLDGGEPYLLLRRADTGLPTIYVSGKLIAEFDLTTPPS